MPVCNVPCRAAGAKGTGRSSSRLHHPPEPKASVGSREVPLMSRAHIPLVSRTQASGSMCMHMHMLCVPCPQSSVRCLCWTRAAPAGYHARRSGAASAGRREAATAAGWATAAKKADTLHIPLPGHGPEGIQPGLDCHRPSSCCQKGEEWSICPHTAHAVHMPCTYFAHAVHMHMHMHMPCTCRAHVVRMPCTYPGLEDTPVGTPTTKAAQPMLCTIVEKASTCCIHHAMSASTTGTYA
eukprot:scaffold61231_cov65-Phaeocystis_antarctica.AAC.2